MAAPTVGQTDTSDTLDITTGSTSCPDALVSLVSDKEFYIFQWVFMTVLRQLLDISGIVTNVINIICFIKQGFKDPVNVSLLGLAVSDLCSLASLLWSNICLGAAFIDVDVPFNPIETQYLISGIPHTVFARITGWITALITLERCLCVKGIITSRRVSIVIIFVFIINIMSTAPIFVANRLEMIQNPQNNKSVLRLVFTETREDVDTISFMINNALLSPSSFLMILICTGILVFKLNKQRKWRMKSTSNEQSDSISIRNQRVAKMVVIISLVFIVCFVPISINFLAMTLVPGLSIEGQHKNILIISASCGIMLESVNSSVNIFVYYRMSTKYREVLHNLLSLHKYKRHIGN